MKSSVPCDLQIMAQVWTFGRCQSVPYCLLRLEMFFCVLHTAAMTRKNDFLLSVIGSAEIYEQVVCLDLRASQATGRGGRDGNWRCGHSRSLQTLCANHGVDAYQHRAQAKLMREVLTDNSYRRHHASVKKVA